MQTQLPRRLTDPGKAIEASPVSPAALAELLKLVASCQITGSVGKKVFATMFESGRCANEIGAAEGLGSLVDDYAVEKTARGVIEQNPDNVPQCKTGKKGLFQFFVGPVMR